MHHIALNGAGADDCHLDHQIVEATGLESGQHAHLRPALDLKHPHRVGPRHHLIDGRILCRHRGQREFLPAGCLHQIEGPVDRRQHPQRQAIDLENPQFIQIVLVPLHDGAAIHRRRLDRHQFAQVSPRHHHAADMLPQMPRKADQLADEGAQPLAGFLGGIEAGLGQPGWQGVDPIPHIEHVGHSGHAVEREPQHLSHVAARDRP